LLYQDEFGTICLDKYTKISVVIRILSDIQKFKYRPVTLVDLYIGRSLVGSRVSWGKWDFNYGFF